MDFIKKSIAKKIILTAVTLSTIICVVIISIGAFTLSSNLTEVAEEELIIRANLSAEQVKNIFDSATEATLDIKTFADKTYSTPGVLTQPVVNSFVQPDVMVSEVLYNFEEYAYNSMGYTVSASTNEVVGMGILYSPNGFWNGVENYAVYYTADNAGSTPEHFADYSVYADIPYYVSTKNSKKTYVTAPYYEGDVLVVTVCEPLLYNGEFIGVVGSDIDISNFDKIKVVNEKYPSLSSAILDYNANVAYDTEGMSVGSAFVSNFKNGAEITSKMGSGSMFNITAITNDGVRILQEYTPIKLGDYTWWSVTSIDEEDVNSVTYESIFWLVIVSLICMAVSLVVLTKIISDMLSPINKVVYAANEISQGNFDVNIDINSEDEIGILSKNFLKMSDNLKTVISDIKFVLKKVSDKDLVVEPSATYVGDLKAIEDSMLDIVHNINSIMTDINTTTSQVFLGAEQLSSASQVLAQGATEQASSVSELSENVATVSNEVTDNAKKAKRADELGVETNKVLQKSIAEMSLMLEAMTDISNSSNEIGKIIKVIDDIAFQTNILALNAAVEAARAGASGKGFAVVADEVRNLAQKSSDAVSSSTVLIQNSIKAIENGSGTANSVNEAFEEACQKTTEILDVVKQIADSTYQQAAEIIEIEKGISSIASVVQVNSATSEETAASSQELSAQATLLKSLISQFKTK